MEKLKYIDEKDRTYGATGMAIGLVIFDGEDMLASISIDGEGGRTVAMTPDFYFAGNPGVSAKSAWNQIIKNYNIGLGMLISNLLCRSLVKDGRPLSDEVRESIHSLAIDEGRESCELETDEIDRLFNKNLSYLTRVFSHRGVQSVAHDFASALMKRRTLSRLDTLELLDALKML